MDPHGMSSRLINIMNTKKRTPLHELIAGPLDCAFTGLAHGSLEFPIRAALLYRHVDQVNYYSSQMIENTTEEVDAIIEGINRVNARWPGALRPVHPPKPKPEDLSQVLWIMDSMIFWPNNRNEPPASWDIIAVATGVVPDWLQKLRASGEEPIVDYTVPARVPRRLSWSDLIKNSLELAFRGLSWEVPEAGIRAGEVYQQVDDFHYSPAQFVPNTSEEVDGFIAAMERIREKWPHGLRQVAPAKPKPADLNQVIWIMNRSIFGPDLVPIVHAYDILAVATGVVPEWLQKLRTARAV